MVLEQAIYYCRHGQWECIKAPFNSRTTVTGAADKAETAKNQKHSTSIVDIGDCPQHVNVQRRVPLKWTGCVLMTGIMTLTTVSLYKWKRLIVHLPTLMVGKIIVAFLCLDSLRFNF